MKTSILIVTQFRVCAMCDDLKCYDNWAENRQIFDFCVLDERRVCESDNFWFSARLQH